MQRILVSFTPFMVCLFWFIVFIIGYRSHNPAKRTLTWFLLTCTVLYLCHGLFFTNNEQHVTECIWALCSLSVYPLYYLYIRALTTDIAHSKRQYCVLLPGAAVAIMMYFFPGPVTNGARVVLFTMQIVLVCIYGTKMLKDFDKLVASYYADTDGRETASVKSLLIALALTSVFSAIANFIGKSFFADNDMLLLPVAALFSTLLFSLSYIGYTRDFSFTELSEEIKDEPTEEATHSEANDLGRKIDELLTENKLYTKKGLKISDIASLTGSNRTYVSQYINTTKGEPFSDYINRLRIEQAKTILKDNHGIKNLTLAELLGFSNEQSFYRNFRKFTGMTPAEWKKRTHN